MNNANTDNLSANINDASWNRARSLGELRAFIEARDEALDVAEFDF